MIRHCISIQVALCVSFVVSSFSACALPVKGNSDRILAISGAPGDSLSKQLISIGEDSSLSITNIGYVIFYGSDDASVAILQSTGKGTRLLVIRLKDMAIL